MYPIILLIAAGLASASPVTLDTGLPMNPGTNGIIYSSLTVSYDTIDPVLGGLRFTINDPVFGPQYYDAGGYLLTPVHGAIIGDTVAMGITTQFGALLGLFLIHYNDGLGCNPGPCNLLDGTAPNVTRIRYLNGVLDPNDGIRYPGSEVRTYSWFANNLTVDVFGFMHGHEQISYSVPYRSVIPEPATSTLAGLGLAALILAQYKRSR